MSKLRTSDKITLRDIHGYPCVINKQEKKDPEWLFWALVVIIALVIGAGMARAI